MAERTRDDTLVRTLTQPLLLVRLAMCVALAVLALLHERPWATIGLLVVTAAIASDWIVRAVRSRNLIYASVGLYVGLIGIGTIVRHSYPSSPLLWVIAGPTGVAACFGLLRAAVAGFREKELNRLMFSEASAVAFFAMMVFGITYGVLDSWLGFPTLSAWIVVAVGAVAWTAVFVGLQRRYS